MSTATPFRSFGEMLGAVVAVGGGGDFDPRLRTAAGGQKLGSGVDGGFLVPMEISTELVASAFDEAVLAPLCDRRVTSRGRRGVKIPAIDEVSRAEGGRWGGTRAFWVAEADQIPASRPSFREVLLQPNKLATLAYATDELASDAPALDGHLRRAFGAEMGFRLDDAILWGTGAGMPLGIANAPATITVAKVSGQTTGTIVVENVRAMWRRLPVRSRRRAVWIVAEDVEDALIGEAFRSI